MVPDCPDVALPVPAEIHNAVDGSLIVAAFRADPTLGLAVVVAILIREIPRKSALMLVLVHSVCERGTALGPVALSTPGIVGGAIADGRSLELASEASPVLLVFATAMVLHVAIMELLPAVRPGVRASVTSGRAACMFCGIVRVSASHRAAEARS